MVDAMIIDSAFLILSVIIAVYAVSIIRDFIRWYKNSSRTISKTERTAYELKKLIEGRSGMGRTYYAASPEHDYPEYYRHP